MYRKISTVVVFNAPRIFPGEEHRSRSARRRRVNKGGNIIFYRKVCLQVSWDIQILEGLDDSLGLLSLKLEDLSSFHEAAAERRARDHVSSEALEILPDI
jgi:hypothetical protein